MDTIEKQKRIYFLFSAMENMEQHDKIICELVINYFVDNNNNYARLTDIADSLLTTNQISISPEHLDDIIVNTSKDIMFEGYLPSNVEVPICLKKEVYDSLTNISSLIEELQNYVEKYLVQKSYPLTASYDVIELLLEAIFKSNIRYLKDILTVKQEHSLTLRFGTNNNNFPETSNRYYNNMLLEANAQFDEILSKLIMRMFDFLSLNCAIDKNQIIAKRLANKSYYLDSSFILRLLGFDNKYREIRSKNLINILKNLNNCHFYIHTKTLEEAQIKINQIISDSFQLLCIADNKTSNLTRIIRQTGKTSNVLDLYERLRTQGKVASAKDFKLYFSQIKYLLFSIFTANLLTIDNSILKRRANSNKAILADELSHTTQKTNGRINHIVKLLDYIENLRGANNYNPFDIEYWLITTDQNTLELDATNASDYEGKSVCIMPTELIRMIDGVNEIVGDHLDAFKKFIMSSHGYAMNYTKQDVDTVIKITTMIDNIPDYQSYDVEHLINNFFTTHTLRDIEERTMGLNEKEQISTIVDAFIEANQSLLSRRDMGLVYKIRQQKYIRYKRIFWIIVYIIPILTSAYILLCFIKYLLPTHRLSWINPEYKDFLVFILNAVLYKCATYLWKHYSDSFAKSLADKYIRKIQE